MGPLQGTLLFIGTVLTKFSLPFTVLNLYIPNGFKAFVGEVPRSKFQLEARFNLCPQFFHF